MKFHIMTLFPDMVMNGLSESITGRAMEKGNIQIHPVNIRDFSDNKYRHVDDYTYGGGAGMLMQPEPVYRAYQSIVNEDVSCPKKPRVLYMTPQGTTFSQKMAEELAKEEELVLLCGHYEGIDERVLEEIVTDYVSIGDFVLTGGELPAMMIIDAVSRLIPGVLGCDESALYESFYDGLLEYPQYTRPEVWHERKVPDVLLSGHHKNIADWRYEMSLERTKKRRPDLYEAYVNSDSEVYKAYMKKQQKKLRKKKKTDDDNETQ